MAGSEAYGLLRSAVRSANNSAQTYPARLRSLAALIARAISANTVTIYLVDPERQYLHLNISSSGPRRFSGCHVPVGAGIAGTCARTGKRVDGCRDDLHPEETAAGDTVAITALPLEDCGVLTAEMATRPDGTTDLALLDDIVPAIAGVIHRVNLSAASRRRVRALTALGEIGHALNRPLLPRKLAALLLQTIQKNTDTYCTVLRLREGAGLPPAVFSKYRRRPHEKTAAVISLEESISSRAADTGTTVMTRTGWGDDLPPTAICVPLQVESRILGTLTFFGKLAGDGYASPFDTEDRDFCESIATLASTALAGAAHYQQTVRLSTANDKRLRELSLLYRLSNTMLGTISINKLVHLTLTALTSGSGAIFERAMLFLINERTGTIQGMLGVDRDTSGAAMIPVNDRNDPLTRRWDISDEAMTRQTAAEFSRRVREIRLPLDRTRNVTSRAILDRKLVHVPDASREPLVDRDFVRRFGITSFAAAPLIAKERAVGVVVVDNPRAHRPISRDALRILKLMANQAGAAIENAMLYNELKEAGLTLSEAQERIIQGERLAAIGEMAAGLAHELKGPLVSIGGFARRLEKKLHPDNQEHQTIDIIIRETQRLELMLSDILSFSRKTTICYEGCDIDAIVNESLELASEQMAGNGITLDRRTTAGISPILGDAKQLKQVFLNLFLNAVEAMGHGGTLQVGVERTCMDNMPAVAVIVSDTGGGIPVETLHNIFSPFFTTKQTGTGLGLPIVHKIVTQHGGRINVSNLGGGAEFRVILPEHP